MRFGSRSAGCLDWPIDGLHRVGDSWRVGEVAASLGNGVPLELDYNGLVGDSPGGASVRSESAVALEVLTCAKWDSLHGNWRRKAGASAVADTRFAPHRDSF